MKTRSSFQSFKHAFNGLMYVVRTQSNMQRCILLSLIVLLTGYILQLNTTELVLLCIPITFLLLTEMLNTAAETAIDLANGKAYHPLVKIIKDITAGAVLVALTGLGSVTFILYFDHLPEPIISYLEVIKHYAKYAMPPVIIAICAMVVTFSVKKGEDVFKSPAHHLED